MDRSTKIAAASPLLVLFFAIAACEQKQQEAPKKEKEEAGNISPSIPSDDSSADDDDDDDGGAADTTDADAGTAEPSGSGPINIAALRKSYDDCTSQGKVWRAGLNKGPPDCGDPVATFCCSEAELTRRYPKAAASFQAKHATFTGAGELLYRCSEKDKLIIAHYVKIDTKITYHHYDFDGFKPTAGAATGECTTVSIDQILQNAVPGSTGTTGGSTDSSGSSTDGDIEISEDGG